MKENFIQWLTSQIKEKDNYQNDYEQGYLDALEDIDSEVTLGKFEDIVYVNLKPEYNIEGLKHSKEYLANSVFGGEYLKIINDTIGDFQYYERNKFKVVKVYDYYLKRFIDKKYVDELNEKLK